MKRILTSVLMAALVAVGTGRDAQGQEMMDGRRSSLFDLGIYGGVAYTTDWFESRTVSLNQGIITEADDEEGHRIGFAPIFGANATFYGLPWFGVRLHYGYMPSDLPEADDDGLDNDIDNGMGDESDYFVNNHFYDLSLVVRLPGVPIFSSLVGDLYGWVGGGGVTTNVAGEGRVCVPELLAEGACLSRDPEHASVGQGVVGLGGDVVSLSSNIGIFAELAAHIYDSPVHTGDAFVPRTIVGSGEPFRVADDKYAVTPRLVAGLKFAFGERGPAVVPVPVTPAPPAPPPPPAPAPPPPAPVERPITICVVEGTALTQVDAVVVDGDTLVAATRRPFAQAYPAVAPTYAASAAWYINNDAIQVMDREYVKFGVPRVIPPAQLTYVGDHQGVGVFAETGATAPYQVLYVPLRPGCEFQPYQSREQIRVRGD